MAGCAITPTPQNPVEYRSVVQKGAFGSEFETYEVDKPYEKVVAVIKKKTDECLNVNLIETECINNSCYDYNITYKPTFVSKKGKSELYLQWKRDPDKAIYVGGNPPAGGMYIAVIDFIAASKNKTKVDMYVPSMVFTSAPKAIKHWVNGTNMGCPDFTHGH